MPRRCNRASTRSKCLQLLAGQGAEHRAKGRIAGVANIKLQGHQKPPCGSQFLACRISRSAGWARALLQPGAALLGFRPQPSATLTPERS